MNKQEALELLNEMDLDATPLDKETEAEMMVWCFVLLGWDSQEVDAALNGVQLIRVQRKLKDA